MHVILLLILVDIGIILLCVAIQTDHNILLNIFGIGLCVNKENN